MPRNRTAVIAGVSTVIAIGAVAAFTVPAASDWYHHRHDEASSYKTAAEAKADRASFPRWIPDGATSVAYEMKTTGGDRLLKATLPSASMPAGCTPYKPTANLPGPALKADWFPKDAAAKPTARCGLYYTFLDGNTLYGWQSNTDWIAENKAGSK
ncbi:hypothetical protein FBY35_2846 [Streptomyces sp. SLBN-118]|uniref:hypothetical protein n=1 Tax=Streptomyces sp. SLBN-118 TaxID=2768454 RepID=UPI00115310B5|nr:hypothetical protein [Streptomyces sp. SLBN-118]TQK52411.1 hypothetical protein FBY35_2846 [Streptomyces sp. SLBN-118]